MVMYHMARGYKLCTVYDKQQNNMHICIDIAKGQACIHKLSRRDIAAIFGLKLVALAYN